MTSVRSENSVASGYGTDRRFECNCHTSDDETECVAAFVRKADLTRHIHCVHEKKPQFSCPVRKCLRKGDQGFTRRSHRTEHLRHFHHRDITMRPKDNLFMDVEEREESTPLSPKRDTDDDHFFSAPQVNPQVPRNNQRHNVSLRFEAKAEHEYDARHRGLRDSKSRNVSIAKQHDETQSTLARDDYRGNAARTSLISGDNRRMSIPTLPFRFKEYVTKYVYTNCPIMTIVGIVSISFPILARTIRSRQQKTCLLATRYLRNHG